MFVIVGKLQEDAEIMSGVQDMERTKICFFPSQYPNATCTTPAQHALIGSRLPCMTAKWTGMSSTCLDDSELLACVDT